MDDWETWPAVTCDCGFRLAIYPAWLQEAAIGVLGVLKCPECKAELNNKFKELANETIS